MSTVQQFAVVPFHQHSLLTLSEDGQVYVAMRSVCESMGLQWESQYNRLKRNPVLGSTIFMMNMVAADGKTREVVTLPIDMLNGWLFGIDANRVKPELKETVLRYQRECYRVLADYWQGKGDKASTTQRIAMSRHRLALLKELHRTRDRALRSAIHEQLADVSRSLGLSVPELDSIGWAERAIPDVVVEFWQALEFLDSKGLAYNHSVSARLVAVNFPHLTELLMSAGHPLRVDGYLRRALWESKKPRCLHRNHVVRSAITKETAKCWVFERPELPLLLNRASAAELTSQLLDQLADKPRRDNKREVTP